MKKFLIIDGSSIFYRAFYAMPSLTAPNGKPTGAVVGFANIILKILREQSPDLAAVALDKSKKTFRNDIFTEYKATRQQMPDDLAAQLPLLKEFIEVIGLKTCAADDYEADDIIGTLAKQACKDFYVEILTGDRDVLQLINTKTRVLLTRSSTTDIYDEKRFIEEYGFAPPMLVDYKGLRGDPSDNIPGVKGIGDKTATALIKQFGSLEKIFSLQTMIKGKKVNAALNEFAADARLSKLLAKIVCNVPDITFSAEKFKIEPDLARADKFCGRYALVQAKKKIHDLFDSDNVFYKSTKKFLSGSEAQQIDFEKILAAESLTVAQLEMNQFIVKISSGEIYTARRQEDIQKVFDEFSGKIILSGVKNYLRRFKINDLEKIFDVELAAYLLYPEMESYTCEKLLPLEFDGMQMTDNSLATNATALEKLAALYEKKLDIADLMKLYKEIELPLTKILAKMEERGVVIDKTSLKKKSVEMGERINDITKNIYEMADGTFNVNSSKQLAEVLFDKLKLPPVKKTKTGYSTNAEVLEELRWLHPIAEAILKYRALTKLKSTYLDGLVKLIDKDGRIHTNFNQTVTATGRLSSSDPNLQNIPVRTEEGREIRALFKPGTDFDCILSADYSQIELRLLAHMSGDENLIDAFIKKQDIHARTAAEVFNVPLEEVTPELRRKAKAVNFGIV